MTGASLMLLASPALAQSTATQAMEAIESVTVTGQAEAGGGIMSAVTVPKQRSVITQEYIAKQASGQSIFETLNKVPGFNFTNNDPYGNSGGNIRIHGFDGNHIALTWDGMPLNDTGNYATFTNQILDAEIIGRASVNQGTTDVDSPTAAATGGVVAITTSRPKEEWGIVSASSLGSNNYIRQFVRLDTGAFGPWNTTAFVTYSYTDYDKFKGPAICSSSSSTPRSIRIWASWAGLQLAMHYNSNRNNFYNNPTYYPVVSNVVATATPGVSNGVTPFPLVPGGPSAPNIAIGRDGNFTGTGLTSNAAGFRSGFRQYAHLHPRAGRARHRPERCGAAPTFMACASTRRTPAMCACRPSSTSPTICL